MKIVKTPGFPVTRKDSAEIGVSYASRLVGRFAAVKVGSFVKAGELITHEVAKLIIRTPSKL